jgi:diguanylate cyclase
VLLIDIDNFKRVNDFYGHLEGDTILKEFSKILAEASRTKDLVSRNGGDEFTVLLPDCPLGKAIEVAERIRKNVAIHQFKLSSGKKIQITVSVGITSFSDPTDNIENLLEQADIALYHAKRAGKNRVMVANQEK